MKRAADKKIEVSRRIRGAVRDEHFRTGGTLSAWRGAHMIVPDKRKLASKRGCRGPVRDI